MDRTVPGLVPDMKSLEKLEIEMQHVPSSVSPVQVVDMEAMPHDEDFTDAEGDEL